MLAEGPGWRWVLFVNLPVVRAVAAGPFRLLPGDAPAGAAGDFDAPGALLATGGMLLLVYRADPRARGRLGLGADDPRARRRRARSSPRSRSTSSRANPLFPFSIFRVKGLAAADVTQLIAFAGFYSMFFFVTLYMQDVLGFSPIQAGLAYLPVTAGVAISAGHRHAADRPDRNAPVIVAAR